MFYVGGKNIWGRRKSFGAEKFFGGGKNIWGGINYFGTEIFFEQKSF
ncbi:MAG: hypothetical protein IJ668_06680 [Selenomonadaceae bacterium]|nr:hypothetical protein [Selenomonadaceae bacterium]